jgi:hypothetical protein
MKIIDKTPYIKEDGSVNILDRIQATLKYGLPWYDRIQAQAKIIPVLEKHLRGNFILMRNATLGGTDVELPLILVGPAGIFLINVITEKGVFRAKDDEWGKISGSQFVPAKINQVVRTSRMGQVLQVFLERAGLKELKVESILLSADPGTHVESVRPIVRVVMSDALDRLAASIAQARDNLSPEASAMIAQVILTGKAPRQAADAAPEPEAQPERPTYGFYEPDEASEPNDGTLGEFTFDDSEEKNAEESLAAQPPKRARKGSQRILGMTITQLTILAGILLVWLCIVIAFIAYVQAQFNA